MEQHEEAAGIAFASIVALGVISLVALVALRHGKAVPAWFAGLMVIASLIVSGMMAWTANIGGQIRHTEIRPGAVTSNAVGNDRN
jgi:phosphatidylglycerophosphate synthase